MVLTRAHARKSFAIRDSFMCKCISSADIIIHGSKKIKKKKELLFTKILFNTLFYLLGL